MTPNNAKMANWIFLICFALASHLAMAQATYVGSGTNSNGGSISLTLTVPAGAAAGDMLLALVSVRGVSGCSSIATAPAGWTQETCSSSSGNVTQAVYSKLTTAAEAGTSYTWSGWSSNRNGGIIAVYRGTSGVDVKGSQSNAASTTVTAPSITTTAPNERVVAFFAVDRGSATITPNGSLTARASLSSNAAVAVADMVAASTGATGTQTATVSGSYASVGALVALKSPPAAPTVSYPTPAANPITETAATLNGVVSSNGAPTTVVFEYGSTATYGTQVTLAPVLPAGAVNSAVSTSYGGLACGAAATYHFRIKATNSAGTTFGADQSFAVPCAPTVTTGSASAISSTTATLNATVSSNGAQSSAYFQYGLTAGSYGAGVAASPSTVGATESKTVSLPLSGLACNTTYHYRAFAVNSAGPGYGGDATFATSSSCPVILSKTASNPSATINSSVSFTITATNPNPSAAMSNVVVTDVLPASMTYGTHAVTLGSAVRSGQTITWTLPTLLPGASAQMTVVVTVTAAGPVTNTVTSPGALDASATVVVVSGAYVHYMMEEAVNSWKQTSGEVKDSGTNHLNGKMISTTLSNKNPISPSPTIASQQPSVAGGFCNAGKFDGKTVIEAPSSSFFQFTTTFSASAWIYPTQYPGGTDGSDIYSILSNDTNYEFHIDPAGHLYWWWQLGGVDKTLTSATVIPLDRWTHVAITFDSTAAGAAQRIYINGVLDTNTSALTGTLTSNSCNFYIGGDIYTTFDWFGNKQCSYSSVGATVRSFHGMIDEAKIYNYELSQDQVQADMKLGRLCSGSYDHVRIEHDGKASSCASEPVTVKACMDPLCASLYTAGTVSVTLKPSSGSWTPNPVFITKGVATSKLSNSAISGTTLTLDGTINTNPLPNNTTIRCFDVSSGTPVETCDLPIDPTPCSSSLFNAAEPSAVVPAGAPAGAAPALNLYTKLDGEPFAVDVLAMADPTTINASYSGSVTVDLVDSCPTATQTCTTVSTGNATQTISFPVDESAKGRMTTAPFVCPMAMTNAHVRLKPGASSNYVCSSDAFAVRPTAVQITYTDANGAALVPSLLRAGETPFSITTKVGTYDLSAGSGNLTDATGYTGTLKFGTPDLAPMGTPPIVGGVAVPWTAGSLSSATLIPGTNSGLTYSEVGLFNLAGYWPSSGSTTRDDSSARGIYDDTWTSFDSAQDDCIVGSYSNQLVGNKYGCNFGLVSSQTFGRFIPHHFETSVMGPMTCIPEFHCNVATGERAVYSGQPFAATAITAAAKSTGATKNFMGSYARDVVLSAWSEKDSKNGWASTAITTGALSPLVVPATAFISGVATTNPAVSGVVMPTPSFTFTNKATAPTDVVLRAATTETSGTPPAISADVSSLQNPANVSIEGDVKVISGRLKISNATGSERRTLAVPVQTQYWSGLAWVPNGADNTALTAAAVFRSDPPAAESVASRITPVVVAQTLPGQWVLTLPAPMATGSADLTIALGALGSADYTSCLASHGGTPAGAPWLRSVNGACPAALAGNADPTARVTFGVYTPENRRQVHVRELY